MGMVLAKGRLSLVESVELDERIAEIAEMDTLILVDFLGRRRGPGCGARCFVVLALVLADMVEIAETPSAPELLLADFSGDGDATDGVRDGFGRTGPREFVDSLDRRD